MVMSFALGLIACKKDTKEVRVDEISPAVLAQIKSLGFQTAGAKKISEGYLVEGDIILTSEDLASAPNSTELIYANEEHYRTHNLAKTHSTIKIALNNSSAQHQAAFSAALNEAIRRFNAEKLTIKFQRVSSRAHITVTSFYEESNILGSAGFPTRNGVPYSQINMNTYGYQTSTASANVNYIATIMAHEVGHCIGFRHTDFMDRSFSCGGSYFDEGTADVGALHIAGTPTGHSARSWMLACSDGSDRPFTRADKAALNTLY